MSITQTGLVQGWNEAEGLWLVNEAEGLWLVKTRITMTN